MNKIKKRAIASAVSFILFIVMLNWMTDATGVIPLPINRSSKATRVVIRLGQFQGTRPGLVMAHSVIVKKHGGKIWFESETGKGTTFFIRLPLEMGGAEDYAMLA
jgi:signal transduction histidine kinase